MKLYELTEQYQKLQAEAESHESDQPDGDLAIGLLRGMLEKIEGQFDEKVESCAKVVKSIMADVDAIRAERRRLGDRQKSLENRVEWLKGYVRDEMTAAGVQKIKGAVLTTSVRTAPPSCKVVDENRIPPQFIRVKREPMKSEIIKAFKESGEVPEGVEIVTDKKALSIR